MLNVQTRLRITCTAGVCDPNLTGRLLETYKTLQGRRFSAPANGSFEAVKYLRTIVLKICYSGVHSSRRNAEKP
jgi:hypothetical protein